MGWQTLGIFDFHSADDGMTCMSLGTCSSTQLLMTSFYFDSSVGGMTFKSLGSFHSIRTLMDEFLFHSALDGMACKSLGSYNSTRLITDEVAFHSANAGMARKLLGVSPSGLFSLQYNTIHTYVHVSSFFLFCRGNLMRFLLFLPSQLSLPC